MLGVSYTILICDDEPDIRAAMRRTLRGNLVVEVGSPDEAIEALKSRAFDAIVSDYSLGASTTGLDLLQHVRLQYPRTVRFLVTGNQDLEVVVRAVNEGAVHRYFKKPWDDEKLRTSLEILVRSQLPTE
ncbi:MAG: hypothetical protein H6Q90_4332 [Deltaproteobacteria bacterium]|nr:hypothetical protein [Deltaproteobacteria bacterium]